MNTIDFFNTDCSCFVNKPKFYIIDEEKQPPEPAKVILNEESSYNCKVINNDQEQILFSPLDNVIKLVNDDGTQAKCCDVLLEVNQKLIVFIELKNRKKASLAFNKAVEQLKETISHFRRYYKIENWKQRKAYIANRRQPSCSSSMHEKFTKFKDETNFRLFYGTTVNIDIK